MNTIKSAKISKFLLKSVRDFNEFHTPRHGPMTIDCIDYVTGIGNAHGHNGVHSVLRLGSQLLVVPLTFL